MTTALFILLKLYVFIKKCFLQQYNFDTYSLFFINVLLPLEICVTWEIIHLHIFSLFMKSVVCLLNQQDNALTNTLMRKILFCQKRN